MRDTAVYFMDESFSALGIVEGYSSLQWRESYFGVGRFAMTLAGKHAKLALGAKYVVWTGSAYTGIIEKFSSDTLTATVKGHFLEKELEYRAVNLHAQYAGGAEAVARQLVGDFCIRPADRRIPLLKLGADRGLGGSVSISPMGQTVLGAIGDICLEQEMSFRLRYDFLEHAIAFEMFRGLDRTQGQEENPWCAFSKEFDNVLEEKYTLAYEGRNFFYVAGEGEGAGREVLELDLSGGRRRRELFVDARDLSRRLEGGQAMPMAEYRGLLRTRGYQRAAAYATVESVDISVAPHCAMEYGLGDVVTYANRELGLVMEKRVTEICRVVEPNFAGCRIAVGKSPLTVVDKIKRDRSVGR